MSYSSSLKKARLRKTRRNPALQPGQLHKRRARLILAIFLTVFLIIGIRAVFIQILPIYESNLNHLADRQYFRQIDLAPYRGAIFDRRNEPLAISTRLPSVFINPRLFDPTQKELEVLSENLEMEKSKISALSQKKSYFAWLARKIPKSSAEKIAELKIRGLDIVSEPNRFYPSGASAANLLGVVGMDDKGLVGIERQFDAQLRGTPSRLHLSKDARGQFIFRESHQAAPEQPGHNIFLTIDKAIQEIAEEALAAGVKDAEAAGGFVVVSDPHTGRLLAVANYPTFNPNHGGGSIDLKKTVNKAFMDGFEAGSVIKTFVISEALREKKVTPSSVFDCEGGQYQAGGVRFGDAHKPPKPELTVTETLVHSSNVCTFKIAEQIGSEALHSSLLRFGFGGRVPGLGFPGEARGYISNWQDWKPIRFANIAFGQGFFTNALEIVQGFGAIANGGNLMHPYILSRIESAAGEVIESRSAEVVSRVLSPETAKTMREMLMSVVDDGVKTAKLKNYTAGGKTGTAEKVDPKTRAYSKTKRFSSFAGIAPIRDPHLVIYVGIDEPGKAPYYGTLRAAPIFKVVAEKTLSYLNVAPDRMDPVMTTSLLAPLPD